MNKKLLLVLFLSLVLVVGLAYAKSINQPGEKKASTTVLSKEAGKAQKTAPAVMEEEGVTAEKAIQVVRPHLTKEEVMKDAENEMLNTEPVLEPFGLEALSPFTACVVRNDSGAYRYTTPTWNSTRKFATFLDPEYSVIVTACARPVYPFLVDSVMSQIYLPDSAHFDACAFLLDVDWSDPWCPYPSNDTIGSVGPTRTFFTDGGQFSFYMPLPAGVCVYDRFFACVDMLTRTTHTPVDNCQATYLTGTPCDSVLVWKYLKWNYSVPPDSTCDLLGTGAICDSVQVYSYTKYLSNRIFYSPYMDQRGQTCKGYMWLAAYATWYDMVSDFGTYGFSRIRAYGQTASTNACPADTFWYFKPPYFEQDTSKYAPCGIPDFSQYGAYPNNGVAYCGPAAVANCLWWGANGWPQSAFFGNFWGGWDPTFPPILINTMAQYFQTDPVTGTDINAMQAGIDQLIADLSVFLTETSVAKPTWDYIQRQLRLSQDVILLLGFYQEDPPSVWTRVGGHYVTLAGVNKGSLLVALSDPAVDVAEIPGPGFVCSNGIFIPHTPPHAADFIQHNDAGNTSHDVYPAFYPSPSPGGVVALPTYASGKPIADFLGQNGGPNGAYNSMLPVMTEIEYAVVICPVSAMENNNIWSWDFTMGKTNFGGEGNGNSYGWVWFGGPYAARNDLWDGSVILGTNANDLAVSLAQVGQPVDFQPLTFYFLFDPITWTNVVPNIDGDTARCDYFNKWNPDLKVHQRDFGFYDETNFGKGIKDAIIQEYTITNTGVAPIADVEWAMFLDTDPGANTSPRGAGDSLRNTGGIYDNPTPKQIDYMTLIPITPGKTVPTYAVSEQNSWLYPAIPGGPYPSLDSIMNINRWEVPTTPPPIFDYSQLMVSEKFNLGPGESSVQTYFMWSDSTMISDAGSTARMKLFHLLRWVGFFRGDVNDDAAINLQDAILAANAVIFASYQPKPFKDQADVNADHAVNLSDVIYIANKVIFSGPSPKDYGRWGLQIPVQNSLFGTPKWLP
jgi:hypothetical protein